MIRTRSSSARWTAQAPRICETTTEYTGLTHETHTLEVTAIKHHLLVDVEPALWEWTIVDTTAPNTTIISGPSGTTGSPDAIFEFTGTDNATLGIDLEFECSLNGAAFESCSSPHEITDLPPGDHSFEVRAIDGALNVDGTADRSDWTIVAVNTPAGTDVTVETTAPDGTAASVTFAEVTTPGDTTITAEPNPPAPIEGALYYDVDTTAAFTGLVTICLAYDPVSFTNPEAVRLYHFDGSDWVDVTTSNDPDIGEVCGDVTTLSPFAIVPPETPSETPTPTPDPTPTPTPEPTDTPTPEPTVSLTPEPTPEPTDTPTPEPTDTPTPEPTDTPTPEPTDTPTPEPTETPTPEPTDTPTPEPTDTPTPEPTDTPTPEPTDTPTPEPTDTPTPEPTDTPTPEPTETPTPEPTPSPTPEPVDRDSDGFTNAAEVFMGTDPDRACAATNLANDESGMDAWPLDMNDDRKSNSLDIGRFVSSLNSQDPDPRYSTRFDFNMNGRINTLDIGRYAFAMNHTC